MNSTAQPRGHANQMPRLLRCRNFPRWPSLFWVGPVAPGAAPPSFPAGSLNWLKGFLHTIMSPEDFEKYKGRIDPAPEKEVVPLALPGQKDQGTGQCLGAD